LSDRNHEQKDKAKSLIGLMFSPGHPCGSWPGHMNACPWRPPGYEG